MNELHAVIIGISYAVIVPCPGEEFSFLIYLFVFENIRNELLNNYVNMKRSYHAMFLRRYNVSRWTTILAQIK